MATSTALRKTRFCKSTTKCSVHSIKPSVAQKHTNSLLKNKAHSKIHQDREVTRSRQQGASALWSWTESFSDEFWKGEVFGGICWYCGFVVNLWEKRGAALRERPEPETNLKAACRTWWAVFLTVANWARLRLYWKKIEGCFKLFWFCRFLNNLQIWQEAALHRQEDLTFSVIVYSFFMSLLCYVGYHFPFISL